MLDGRIPEKEPSIRVGILLPADGKKRAEVQCPPDPPVILIDGEGVERGRVEGRDLLFTMEGQNVMFRMDDGAIVKSNRFYLKPVEVQKVSAQGEGVKVRGIPAGRGFHWQKSIDVLLPGILEFQSIGGDCLLIETLNLEDYVMCVTVSEMGTQCPDAFIDAQTIVARSWLLARVEKKHEALGFDVCNDDCCQRYQGTSGLTDAVIRGRERTRGRVLIHDQKICDARYSKCCGGMMEAFENVWPGPSLPYSRPLPDAENPYLSHPIPLRSESDVRSWIEDVPPAFCSPHSVPDTELFRYLGSVDEQGSYFRWEVSYPQEAFTQLLNTTLGLKASCIHRIQPGRRGSSGRLLTLSVHYTDQGGRKASRIVKDQYRIREAMHPAFLYSSAFVVDERGEDAGCPGIFILKGAGWGHGVGFCQIGGLGMALRGFASADILAHYYPGSELVTVYE